MSELTDLEICKRIAEIEGIEHHVEMPDTINAYIYSEQLNKEYNPLKDDGLCFRLMAKHELLVETSEGKTYAWYASAFEASPYVDKSPNRAVCMAVIKKNEVG